MDWGKIKIWLFIVAGVLVVASLVTAAMGIDKPGGGGKMSREESLRLAREAKANKRQSEELEELEDLEENGEDSANQNN